MLATICFSIFVTPVSAAEKNAITSYWVNTISMDASFKSSGTYSVKIAVVQGTSSISATLVLYEKDFCGNYTEVSRKSDTVYSAFTVFEGKYTVKSGKTYRMDISATVTCKGVSESISESVERKI